MDDVVIPTSDAVKTKIVPQDSKPVKPEQPGTIKNFFLMLPAALIVLLQGYFFGHLIGSYTTFPILTLHSYVAMGALCVLLFVIQMCLRSIVYSTLFGLVLMTGVFSAWFGDFWNPLYANIREMVTIVKTSWSHKDIPFPILVSFMMSIALAGMAGAGFFLSLVVKYFFEVVFGREWSDGGKYGFIGAIVLLVMVHLGFNFNLARGSADKRIQWRQNSLYSPLEEFLARTPSGTQWNNKNVWAYDHKEIRGFSLIDQKWSQPLLATAAVLAPRWLRVETPFVPQADVVIGFDQQVLKEIWRVSYPASLPGVNLEDPEIMKGADPRIPILVRAGTTPDTALFMFDFGVWGLLSLLDGKWLWIKEIDVRVRANRVMIDSMFDPGYVQAVGDRLLFACHNGKIVAVNAGTGEKAWEYNDKDPKYGGRSQRAFLSLNQQKVLAAFPAGALVAFDAETGRIIHDQRSSDWHPAAQACWVDEKIRLFSENGVFFEIILDGGKVLRKHPITQNPLPLVPISVQLSAGFGAYKDTLFHIKPDSQEMTAVLQIPNRIIATNIIWDDPFIYVGTQDGWVICLHSESFHEKWRVLARGELETESLLSHPTGLLVRTRSGSLASLRKGL